MRVFDAYVDGNGQRWELLYDEQLITKRDAAGEAVHGERGPELTTQVENFRFRKEGTQEWLVLPPFADILEDAKVTLCMFDEDEESGALTYWNVMSGGDPNGD